MFILNYIFDEHIIRNWLKLKLKNPLQEIEIKFLKTTFVVGHSVWFAAYIKEIYYAFNNKLPKLQKA